ncbi:alpha/beta fold hydrolase [Maribacter sp. 2307ULW6-5]|uniref:alpha/beta fold hydrolase n=1 Tax=Maribacter sp. 2307ULW6-5 TaxID=3386275 RepID=UPI0039BC8EB7
MLNSKRPHKIAVYFMPGMAAGPAIFEHIKLDASRFECVYLEWELPTPKMTLQEYARLMTRHIVHDNPVLLGVSFGGILVQEMARMVHVKKTIIVSSVKCTAELPKKMLFARYTKAHKLLPTGLVNNVELLAKYAFGEAVTKRLKLYERYLSVRDKAYLDWCIDKTVNWKQEHPPAGLVHIHGDKDTVFPLANPTNCLVVKNATHTMIIHRAKWFNEHLPTIILQENSSI